jgi:hypothetical protein
MPTFAASCLVAHPVGLILPACAAPQHRAKPPSAPHIPASASAPAPAPDPSPSPPTEALAPAPAADAPQVPPPPPPPDDKAHSHAQADADADNINGDAHAEVPRARFASAAEYSPLALTGKLLRPLPGAKTVLAPRWHSRIGRGPATATDRGYKAVARRPARPGPAPGITAAQDGAQAGSDTSDSDTSDGEPDDVGMEEPGSAGDRLGTAAPLELNRSGNKQPIQPILQTLR